MTDTPTSPTLPVELLGGMLDGHRDQINPGDEILDRHLFSHRTPTHLHRIAYRFANRTTRNGKRWILEHDCIVSTQTLPIQ